MTYVGLTLPTSTLCNFACTRLQTRTSLDYLFIHFLIINFPATTTHRGIKVVILCIIDSGCRITVAVNLELKFCCVIGKHNI